MFLKTLIFILAVVLGLYGAWWASSLAYFIHLEKVNSFDELSAVMLTWFVAAAAVLCPLLCWGFLRILGRRGKEDGSNEKGKIP